MLKIFSVRPHYRFSLSKMSLWLLVMLAFGSACIQLADRVMTTHRATSSNLQQQLMLRFPSLSSQLTPRAEFAVMHQRVGGREIADFSPRQSQAAKDDGLTAPAGLKPVEQEAWL